MKNTLCKISEKFNIPNTINCSIFMNKDISSLTTFNIGGICDIFIEPHSIQDMISLVSFLTTQNLPFFIFGGGSNLVISDEGIPIPVISTRALQRIELCETAQSNFLLLCESGVSLETLTKYCIEKGLEGLENFAGLPGSVGGAVYMNARCYEKSISDVLDRVYYVEKSEKHTFFCEKEYVFREADWGYKQSPFQKGGSVISKVGFRVQKGDAKTIRRDCEKIIEDRCQKGHFRFPSAGSVFKNNHEFGKSSGKIIDEAGLRGLKIGDAQIAPWHGNFIINTGHARSCDVKKLVELIKTDVLNKFGFKLEAEIIFTQDLF